MHVCMNTCVYVMLILDLCLKPKVCEPYEPYYRTKEPQLKAPFLSLQSSRIKRVGIFNILAIYIPMAPRIVSTGDYSPGQFLFAQQIMTPS